MELVEILPALTAYFEPEEHHQRKIKGGGKWWYVSHQTVRDRLNAVCPEAWQTRYTVSHMEPDGTPIYLCELTICGITKTGIGDKSNEPSPYGTNAQRAFRKAFMDAAEQFGIAAYLDEQRSKKTEQAFVRYMHSKGDGRAAATYHENQRSQSAGAAPTEPSGNGNSDRSSNGGSSAPRTSGALISEPQRKRLYAIAAQEGKYSEGGFKLLIVSAGFSSSKDITKAAYDRLCDRAKDPIEGAAKNQEAEAKIEADTPF